MPDPKPLCGLSEIADQYDAILCDVWGVLHNGETAHEGVAEALREFRKRGPVVLITNAPRPSAPVVEQLNSMGIPPDAYDGIVSSGDVVRAHLIEEGFGSVFHLGPGRDLPLYEDTGIVQAAQPADAEAIVAAGLHDDDADKPEDYRATLKEMAALPIPFICANPDIVVERGGSLIYCAGALAQIYDEEGGSARQFGKPHAPIYDAALQKVRETAGGAEKVLVVGDGLPTDVTGANRQGFDTLFITGGIHEDELGAPGEPDARKVADRLAKEGLEASHFAHRLRW